MARKYSARRYARAVFEIALEKQRLDEWQSGLEEMARLAGDRSVASYLESPDISFEDKARLLSERLGDVEPLVLNLVYLLIARGRFGMLIDITDEYQRLLDKYNNIERAEATTAIPLDEGDKKRLAEKLGSITGKKVILEDEIDHDLIGGVVVRVAGKLLDGSTRGKLEALKRELR
jgi:F-type H+-transporting ATPase subunit delta